MSVESSENRKLKIGLLVDRKFSSKCIADLCEWSAHHDNLSISHVLIVLHEAERKEAPSRLARWIERARIHGLGKAIETAAFEAMVKIESIFMARSPKRLDYIKSIDLSHEIPNSSYVKPIVDAESIYTFSDRDVENIRSLNLDLIIKLGQGAFRGEILNVAKLGVLTVYYTDGQRDYDSATGFWEVYSKNSRTGFSIGRMGDTPEEDRILYRGHITTKGYSLLNRVEMLLASNHYLQMFLERIAETKALPAALAVAPYSGVGHKEPRLSHLCVYFSKQAARKLGARLNELIGRKARWGVAFVRSDWTTAVLCRGVKIQNPPNHFLADPFVITRDGRDYCFVEDLDYSRNRGSIAVYELRSGTATRIGTAIEEPFHLSFPFLFEYENNLYICPETCEAKQIRAYKCIDFPLKWKLEKILINNINAADTMIFENGGLWWMITNIDPTESNDYIQMSIFYAESPLSDTWTAHPSNPVFADPDKGRNGGLLKHKDELYRVSQKQGFNIYGEMSSINKIIRIDKDSYEEVCISEISSTFFKGIFSTHHMHSNNRVTVYDFCQISKISR